MIAWYVTAAEYRQRGVLFAWLGGHQAVELGVFGEAVGEGHKGAAVAQKSATRIRVGDVAHLLVADV